MRGAHDHKEGLDRAFPYLAFLIIASLIISSVLITKGLFVEDDKTNILLSRALWEQHSLDLTPYFRGFLDIPIHMVKPNNAHWINNRIHAGVGFGYPGLAYPLYRVFGISGFQVFNVLVTTLTIVVIFLISKKIWGDNQTAFLSGILYLFCTFALFYALGMWHQPLSTFTFVLAQAALLFYKSEKNSKYLGIFVLSSAICIWTAYFMVIPITVLFLFFVFQLEKKEKVFVGLSFLSILVVSWVYNYYNFLSPFLGKYTVPFLVSNTPVAGFSSNFITSYTNSFILAFGNFITAYIYRGFTLDPFTFYQKSLLESSPFLILAIPGIYELYKAEKLSNNGIKGIIASNVIFVALTIINGGGKNPGWTFSMRYLLPLVPFLVILSSGFITKFVRDKGVLFLSATLMGSTALFYFLPRLPFSDLKYNILLFLSLVLVALLLLYSGLYYSNLSISKKRIGNILVVILVIAVVSSNFINLNDVKVGNRERAMSSFLTNQIEGKTEVDSTILIPRKFGMETPIIKDRVVFYYALQGHPFFYSDFPNGNSDSAIRGVIDFYLIKKKSMYLILLEIDKSNEEMITSTYEVQDISWPYGEKARLVRIVKPKYEDIGNMTDRLLRG